jgi:hypothetical protein
MKTRIDARPMRRFSARARSKEILLDGLIE